MKNLLYILIFLTFYLQACQQGKQKNAISGSKNVQPIGKVIWLVGDWQKQSEKGILTEAWRKLDDSTLVGRSYLISEADTLLLESIRLEQRIGKLYYIPTVSDQNKGQPVIFAQTSLTDSVVVFENPKHDFPQIITYSLLVNDSLSAEIAAVVDGQMKTRAFRMGKVK
jgi:hypothetical protein